MLELELIGLTDLGLHRALNEDSYAYCAGSNWTTWVTPDTYSDKPLAGSHAAIIVADGMGGTEAGEVAASLAITSMQSFFSDTPVTTAQDDDEIIIHLRQGFLLAHDRIVHNALSHPERKGMGTTLISGLVLRDKLFVMWSGDSRVYRFHHQQDNEKQNLNGHLQMISSDHSMVWEMVLQGELTPEQARTHPYSNIITQSLGDLQSRPRPDYRVTPIFKGDILLFCTDGLNGMLPDSIIQEILARPVSCTEMAQALVHAANQNGGNDNITLVLVRITEGPERALMNEGLEKEPRTTAGGQEFLQKMSGPPSPAPVDQEPVTEPRKKGLPPAPSGKAAGSPASTIRQTGWIASILSLIVLGWLLFHAWAPPKQNFQERTNLLRTQYSHVEDGQEVITLLDSFYQAFLNQQISESDMEDILTRLELDGRIPQTTGILGKALPTDPLDSLPNQALPGGDTPASGYWPPKYTRLLEEVEKAIKTWEQLPPPEEESKYLQSLFALRDRINSHFTPDGSITLKYKSAEKEYQACVQEWRKIQEKIRWPTPQNPTIPPAEPQSLPADSIKTNPTPTTKSSTQPTNENDSIPDEE